MKCLNCGKECGSGDNAEIYDGLCWRCHDIKVINEGLAEYFKYKPEYKQGWVCPKCGSVMSPSQPYCLFCCSYDNMPISIKATWTSDDTNIEV